ncbi:BnaA02g23570D [Brassica napus]|uniref:BnaA02g23570D protein n=2 Tax=Brassica napus TaxID=3708 RepID=A0A078HRE1_BRANA|nr:BnaA02g23570D [Brassica napus]
MWSTYFLIDRFIFGKIAKREQKNKVVVPLVVAANCLIGFLSNELKEGGRAPVSVFLEKSSSERLDSSPKLLGTEPVRLLRDKFKLTKRVRLPSVTGTTLTRSVQKRWCSCLSVLTDQKYFKEGFENLEAIRRAGVKIWT